MPACTVRVANPHVACGSGHASPAQLAASGRLLLPQDTPLSSWYVEKRAELEAGKYWFSHVTDLMRFALVSGMRALVGGRGGGVAKIDTEYCSEVDSSRGRGGGWAYGSSYGVGWTPVRWRLLAHSKTRACAMTCRHPPPTRAGVQARRHLHGHRRAGHEAHQVR